MDETFTILTDSSISKDNEQIRIAIYANIGFFIQVSQMLEYNLRKLICYVKSVNEIESGEITKKNVQDICKKYDDFYTKTYTDRLTLGALKNELGNLNLFENKVMDIFTEINQYRVTVVHMIFQNNIISQSFKSSANVNKYIKERLIPKINQTESLNKLLIKSIKAFRKDLRKYKEIE